MKFKRITLLSSLAISLIASIWVFQMCFIRQKDFDFYKELMRAKEIASSKPSYSSTNQHRKDVRKDIWFAQEDDSRLQYRIESLSSILTLIPIKNKFEVVESLNGIKCWTQDKLYFNAANHEPMQQARYLEATEGIYRFATQQFTSQNVALSLFQLPGHHLHHQNLDAKKAFLSGLAQNVCFKIAGKTPHFQAEQFKATLIREVNK